MVSPIRDLDRAILSAVFSVAPAKAQELFRFLEQRNVEFDYIEDAGFVFRAASSPSTGIIEASVPSLELLWCASYCYWEMYQLITAVQNRSDRSWTADELVRRGRVEEMFGWSLMNVHRKSAEDWPSELSRPEASSTFGSLTHVSTELFLVALGWILHHEIGHIVHSHSTQKGRSKRDQEREADEAANLWLFNGVSDRAVRQKMALGLVTALCMLSARRQPGKDSSPQETHPHPLERLVTALNQCNLPEDNVAYAYAISALQMNMVLTNFTYVPGADAPFRTLLESLCCVVRTHQSSEYWSVIATSELPKWWAKYQLSPTDEEIRPVAYSFWEERGKPWGSPEEDWFRAEDSLRRGAATLAVPN
jgi:hypothetical protein